MPADYAAQLPVNAQKLRGNALPLLHWRAEFLDTVKKANLGRLETAGTLPAIYRLNRCAASRRLSAIVCPIGLSGRGVVSGMIDCRQ